MWKWLFWSSLVFCSLLSISLIIAYLLYTTAPNNEGTTAPNEGTSPSTEAPSTQAPTVAPTEASATQAPTVAPTEPPKAEKAKNTMTVKAKKATARAKKKTTLKAAKVFTVKNAVGKVSYKKVSGNKNITVKANGAIVVRKRLKKGKTYTVKVKVTARGDDAAKALSKTVFVKILIK